MRDVADMRDRIAQHAPAKSAWDFKHLPGGLFDIDFVAQYLALRHAAARPDLLDPHPAEMLRRMADAGLIERGDAERLRATRTLLSDVQSLLRLTLNGDEAAFDETKAPEGQQRLIAATEGATDLAGAPGADRRPKPAAVRAIYERIVEAPARAAGWTPRRGAKEANDECRRRQEGAGFHRRHRRRQEAQALRPARQAGGALLLSQGRHAGLHHRGLRLPRRRSATSRS